MRMREVRNERGASIVIVAVSLFAMLGMAALAIDMGMLLKVRSDAQRTADAAALAGAGEFLNGDPIIMRFKAADSALTYAARNYVGWSYVDTAGALASDSGTRRVINSPEAYVQAIPDSQKVRVWVRRSATSTWFGNLLGLDWVPIAARAAAQAIDAGSGKCVKPFAIPDLWGDADNDTDPRNPNNRLPDIAGQQQGGANNRGEEWAFDPTKGDSYKRFKDPNSPDPSGWTGYGSSYRNGPPSNTWYADDGTLQRKWFDDYGRPMTIKMSNPQDSPSPGFFYPWSMPYDSSNPGAYCDANGVCQDPGNGASFYKWSISHCNPAPIIIDAELNLDATYLDKPGNMIGPTNQGIKALMDDDKDACWQEFADPDHVGFMTGKVAKKDAAGNCTVDYPNWESSPRVMLVPLFDPNQIKSGRTKLAFNNLALIFLEGQTNAHAAVYGRFLYFAKSTGPTGPRTGSLVKKLQLVE
jgi:hypothetical protein